MCSTCDVSRFNSYKGSRSEIFFNTFREHGKTSLFLETKDKRNFKLVASSGDGEVSFTIYRCPTCGGKLY